jgi:hypothetical protein
MGAIWGACVGITRGCGAWLNIRGMIGADWFVNMLFWGICPIWGICGRP